MPARVRAPPRRQPIVAARASGPGLRRACCSASAGAGAQGVRRECPCWRPPLGTRGRAPRAATARWATERPVGTRSSPSRLAPSARRRLKPLSPRFFGLPTIKQVFAWSWRVRAGAGSWEAGAWWAEVGGAADCRSGACSAQRTCPFILRDIREPLPRIRGGGCALRELPHEWLCVYDIRLLHSRSAWPQHKPVPEEPPGGA